MVEFREGNPAALDGREQNRLPPGMLKPTGKSMKGNLERRVIVADLSHFPQSMHAHSQFLLKFTHQGGFRSFPRVQLTSGKLP